MRNLLFVFVLFFLSGNVFSQKKSLTSTTTAEPLDSLVVGMKASKGFITTYLGQDNKLYFELSNDVLNKELLAVTRFAQLPANYSGYLNAGSKTSERVVVFEKMGKRILMKERSYTNISDKVDPITLSVNENNFAPILASFTIENEDTERYLIDVSSYFMDDSPGFNIIRASDKKKYKIGSVDKSRSFIEQANSFPKNTEILHTDL